MKYTRSQFRPLAPPLLAESRSVRAGFTLFELLLVLAIVVLILAAGLPAVLNSLSAQRLTASAERVQTEFMRARVDAMESGRIRMFRFEQETGNFTVAPFIRSSDELENNLAGTSQGVGVSNLVMQSAEQETHNGQLEEGVLFAAEDVTADMRSFTLGQEQGDLEISGWSRPVLFYPDGTTSDATVYLRGAGESLTAVELRGLTGIARIVEPDLASPGE